MVTSGVLSERDATIILFFDLKSPVGERAKAFIMHAARLRTG